MKSIAIALTVFAVFVIISSITNCKSGKMSTWDHKIEKVRKSLGFRVLLIFLYIHMGVILVLYGTSH